MDLNQDVNPWAAALVLAVIGVVLSVLFWATGEESKARAGSYFLEHDRRGNLSVQMDHMLIRLSPEGETISSIDLRNLGAKDVMGNIAYFGNGDFLFRAGEPESGIKSYLSLGQLPPVLKVRQRFPAVEVDLEDAEKRREEWVKTLDAQSGLNRCDPLTGECTVFLSHNVSWRYRLFIDDEKSNIYLTEGTNNLITVLNLQGQIVEPLQLQTKFPKRVRSHEDRLYLVDTNNHRVIFFDDKKDSNFSPTFHNTVPANPEGRRWPIDAIYFDDYWWVINADSGMTNSHLLKFDQKWHFIERITLPDNADPFDMVVYNRRLIVSDVRFGSLYEFDSAMSSPDVKTLEDVTAYIDYLSERRQLFANVKKGVWIAMGLFFVTIFAVLIAARRKV